jgi:ribonuclease HI
LIQRAEDWLSKNTYSTQILKRNTKERWEIPADFGRK